MEKLSRSPDVHMRIEKERLDAELKLEGSWEVWSAMRKTHLESLKVKPYEENEKTLVFKTGMAKSIHHARVLIKERHISPFGVADGRMKRKNQKAAAKKAGGGDAYEDDEE
ncbi:hypothetical protein CTI12_AA432550 [Artemisia annua]|uniref:Uncharacterized protein n=1 Tax=Artemisia annua TaxID=35608 RepID=A0A2U1M0D9_ARTAN|nr:hypothetical protein CTI12_AA432550 [Artemisia annua]